ncbi:DNA-binding transcriptional regulator YdaS (Cro superfamily) [Tepidimonas ignava]|uniref:Antitoxin of bacterial toxin-antitoxin system, YdaS/YdaT n=1 Tax=Tepidimonas ignava TaxID=114249 RepID=A0A4R3LH11_9BURK|nr:YdaS family helix-turn-helix protein [Tepidimonas ignava]TCS98788.1 DNA-binding transcriptional regulator YdaS (Cro superfamily) [Tepidimonas ignava]TSE20287.1 putative antitoxin of bacterial toxin-antitoxin system, YdaS/YdaT [Tepidimonas ignava]
MRLKEYLDTLPRGERKRLAQKLGVSLSYLCQMASGVAHISPLRSVQIEKATSGVVPRQHTRADWRELWPELSELDSGTPVTQVKEEP